MKILTTGQYMSRNTDLISLTSISAEDAQPAKDRETGEFKLVEGKQRYSLSGATLRQDGKVMRDVYISVFEPCDVEELEVYKLDGLVIVQTFGKITTVTAERVIPASDAE